MTTTEELERRLRDLSRALDLPETDDLSTRVLARIERAPAPTPRGWLGVPRWAAAATVVALIAVVLLVSPGARQAVADLFRVIGLDVRVDDVDAQLAEDLALGDETTLDDARVRAGYELVAPASLGAPDAVYLDDDTRGAMVWFVYAAGPGLPETHATGVGALFSQFPATLGVDRIEKVIAAEGSEFQVVDVLGEPAIWIEGGEHAFRVTAPDGSDRFEPMRLAGNTLLWQHGELTLRLESALDLDMALSVAGSVVVP